MEEQRYGAYRGFEMSSTVDGEHTGGFRVVARRVQLTVQGTFVDIPIDDVAAGRFMDLDSAFVASFASIQVMIDRHIEGLDAQNPVPAKR